MMLPTDNRMTLADLLSMQQDNSDPSVQYSTGQPSLSSLTRGRTEEEINKLLSVMQMRTPGFDPNFMSGKPYTPPQAMPQNYVQRGNNAPIDMDQRQPMPQNYIQRGNNAPIDLGQSRRQHDVFADGPQVLSRQQQPDGTFLVTKRVASMDHEGRQSADVRQYIETPDYLNPAKLKEMQFKLAMQKLSEGEQKANAARQAAINPEGIKLKPGEHFVQGAVESIPGSDLFINQSNKHGKDYQALQGVNVKAKSAIDKVDEILGDKDAFNSNFGGYNAYLTQYLPGASSDTRKKIEGLKSDLKAAGLELMRSGGSIGAMTEREWPIVEAMIANISPMLSEEEAAFQLAKVKTRMDQMAKNAQEAYSTEWGSTQFGRKGGAKPDAATPSPSAPVRINNDADYAALPSGATFVSPDGKTRRKP